MRTNAGRLGLATAAGFALGALLGYGVGLSIRSDNLPFLVALGAAIGLCVGLAIGLALGRWRAA